ncbi:MAG: succinate dehydrogenase assembly factor 2 [Gammaproteobacteria bacterium]
MSAGPAVDRGRLRWRCRRGMKELDVMLVRWLDGPGQGASSAETAHFDRLLDLPDPELAAYLLRGEPATDPELAALVAAIRRLPADG